MKKLILPLLSCFVMVFAAHAQQHAAQGNAAHTIDPQATAAAPWKVGETIAIEQCLLEIETPCNRKYLGSRYRGNFYCKIFMFQEKK